MEKQSTSPHLTLKDCGVTSGDVIEFLGDFEPPKSAAESQSLVEVHVTLLDDNKAETGLCSRLQLVTTFTQKKGIRQNYISLNFLPHLFSVFLVCPRKLALTRPL